MVPLNFKGSEAFQWYPEGCSAAPAWPKMLCVIPVNREGVPVTTQSKLTMISVVLKLRVKFNLKEIK